MRVAACIASLLLGGCSLINASAHARPRTAPNQCGGYSLPMFDTFIAAGLLATGTYAAIDSRDAPDYFIPAFSKRDQEIALALALLAAGGLTAVSAAFG